MKIDLPGSTFHLFHFFLIILIILVSVFNIKNHTKVLDIASDNPIVFDDQLLANWENWSWGSNINFNGKESVFSGSTSIEFTPSFWGGLYLHANKALDITKYKSLQFTIKTTDSNQRLGLLFYDINNQLVKSFPLNQFGEAQVNVWKTYDINLNELSLGTNQISGIAFQERTGNNQSKIYIDSIQFTLQANTSSSTPTPDLVIYHDILSTNWENWSWGGNVQLDNVVSFTPNEAWAGLFLSSKNPEDTVSFSTFHFKLKPSENNQKFSVILAGFNYQVLSSPVPIENYGGLPTKDIWKEYNIPLTDLKAVNQKIKGIIIQESLGKAQQTVYINDISLTSNSSSFSSWTPSLTPTPTQVTLPKENLQILPTPTIASQTPAFSKFTTLPPGSALPTTEECAQRVRRSGGELRPENYSANHKIGTPLPNDMEGTSAEGQIKIKERIDGNFTGTTDEIIQWGACKWGFDEEDVRAVAAQESWWRQSTLGDWNGNDYESYGLLQVRKTSHVGTYPLSRESVPFNVDYALAWRRACFEGYFYWIPASAKGDEWGCIGLWFSGKWRDGDPNVAYSGANWYIGKVQEYINSKPWLKSGF